MRRILSLLLLLIVLTGCAGRSFIPEPELAPPDAPVALQYLLPPTFADDYDVLPEPVPFADERGFLVAIRPRGGSATITIGGGTPARAVWEQNQPIEGSDRIKKTLLRGVQGVAVIDPSLITMAWVAGGVPYFVSVTTADDKTVQIFINALAVYDLDTWRSRVGR
ncbi:MAG TPA: hypothetical protein DEF43_09040 [Chloroflexus aurantiacus]|uniref:Lipoprotein n=1 Tax=Chloroflexus aurantiacus (strain ATCC 29366 / DSM 635 / J-10-fl) TaxID=324602 RepID=A9WEM3_CHLAA|nr:MULTISPECIES: lipoprotein [Chloroflexus]ABY36042.1 hypothetical protein Caur_2841 [Chloroflexus aurantiacus J-10-fl]RMG50771.1 MAG: hypothetical protein D6716_07775 [Chloroflexota bacterium]GIV91430.1 MAG: hypothetical protein KatS3mg056_0139 [Chloroflexus sp.]HBW67291.1 hypothetical protein [Chloroflexus aurantiacus]